MKKNRLIYGSIFLLVIIISYFINSNYYYYDFVRKFSEFTFWMSFSVFIFSVITVFIKENAHVSWRKFTKWFLVIAVLVILITPNSGNSGGSLGMNIYAIDKELVTFLLSGLYAVISLPLIIYKSFKNE